MDNDFLIQQKIEILFDMGFKKIINEIKSVKEEISLLKNDLNKMQHELNGLSTGQSQISRGASAMPLQQRIAQPQQMQQRMPAQVGQQQSQMQQPQQRLAPIRQQVSSANGYASDQPIDRNNVSPASVSIDKIFYSGGKK